MAAITRARQHRRLALTIASLIAASLPLAGPGRPLLAPPTVRAATVDECASDATPHNPPSGWVSVQVTGAAALGGEPAWAVGFHTWNGEFGTPIARWTGSGWQRVAAPWENSRLLNAVSAAGANAAWTVGKSSNRPIVARWNGTSWLQVTPPAVGGSMATFTDVAAVSGRIAWMAGARLIGGRLKPLVVRRKRTTWSIFTPTLPATSEGGLTAITRAPGGRLWVAGWRADAATQLRPWLLYWSGSAWETVPTAEVADGRAGLTSLAFAADDDGWLAGYVETATGYQPILQHWDGAAWSDVATPWTAADSVLLHGVGVDATGMVTVAGTMLRDSRRVGVVGNFDGAAWQPLVLDAAEGWLVNAVGTERGSLTVGMHGGAGVALLSCAVASGPALQGGSGPSRPLAGRAAHAHDEETPAAVSGSRWPAVAAAPLEGFEARDVTVEAGLEMTVRTYGATPADFNGDGHLDFYLNRHTETEPELWLGSATGTFALSEAAFSFEDRHDCETADVNADGALDLFCTMGANSGNSTWPNELLLGPLDDNGPLADGGTDATAGFGLLDAFGRGREATFLNLDGDAYPDLFITNEPERSDGMPSTTRLYRNVDGTGFAAVPEWGIDRSMGGICAAAADLDADGDDDLVVCTARGLDGAAAGARLLINDGTRFADRTRALGFASGGERDVEVADFNGDGRLDIAAMRRTMLRIHLGQADGSFDLATGLSFGNNIAIALGDVNGDARPDIFLARRSAQDAMLVNDGTGAAFAAMTIPQPTGATEDVVALDYDGNGLTDFLSLNGSGPTAGPLKLIAFFETAPSP